MKKIKWYNYPYFIWKLFSYRLVLKENQNAAFSTWWPWRMTYKAEWYKLELEDWNESVNHEKIHALQMLDFVLPALFVIIAYSWWVGLLLLFGQAIVNGLNWFATYMATHDTHLAYRNSLMEAETYTNDKNLEYRYSRVPFAWIKYIWIKGNR